MTFQTQWNPLPIKMEECSDSMTETAGYVPTERLIQSFEEAGIRLEIARDFDFPNEDSIPDDYDPVTFRNRLDALTLDSVVKQRLMDFVQEKKKAVALAESKEKVPTPEVKE